MTCILCFVFYLLIAFFGLKSDFLTCLIIRCTEFNLLILATIFQILCTQQREVLFRKRQVIP